MVLEWTNEVKPGTSRQLLQIGPTKASLLTSYAVVHGWFWEEPIGSGLFRQRLFR